MQAINKNIKKLRSIKGLSQSDFADLFELSRANIGSYEEGRAQPKIDAATRIANYFSISLDDFVNKELSVNDLSGFSELKENAIRVGNTNESRMISVPYVHFNELRKFLSLGKAKDQITIPKEHGADIALRHSGHHLEGKDGVSDGDILLLKRIKPTEIQNGFIHAFWRNDKLTVGICLLERDSVEIRGIENDTSLESIPKIEIGKTWRLQSTISSRQRNYDHILLSNRMSELEDTLKKFISENK